MKKFRRQIDRFLKYHGMPLPGPFLGYSAFTGMLIDWDHPERYIVVRCNEKTS